jgi:hypothetical protein
MLEKSGRSLSPCVEVNEDEVEAYLLEAGVLHLTAAVADAHHHRTPEIPRAGVADGIVSALHIEEGYFLAFDCERSRLTGWHVLGLSYFEKFCIMLESV